MTQSARFWRCVRFCAASACSGAQVNALAGKLAKRMECAELAPALDYTKPSESAGKPDALHTLARLRSLLPIRTARIYLQSPSGLAKRLDYHTVGHAEDSPGLFSLLHLKSLFLVVGWFWKAKLWLCPKVAVGRYGTSDG